VKAIVAGFDEFHVPITKSQIAFRRRRGFAFLWKPGMYLRNPTADVVLSIALGRRDESSRFKEVVHVSAHQWMHHLEIGSTADIDEHVASWLREAAERAG
jgi:uncharacterized protein DUF5655